MPCGSPVIYIPGILSSQLYLPEDGRKLWFSAPAVLAEAKRLDIHSELLVKNNGIDLQTLSPLEREHGVLRQDIILIEWLCHIMRDSPVYFFSYDFRQSCCDTAEKLHEQIEALAKEGYSSVNIVCHSMGGLVTSAYAAKYGTSHLKKVMMLGVPFEGSYEVIRMYLTGDVREIPNTVAQTIGITREMLAGYPGLAELMPSVRHLKANPVFRNGKEMTEEEMETALSQLIPMTYSRAREFQRFVQTGFARLQEMGDCYFGIGYGKMTVQSLSLTDKTAHLKRIETEKGDGLVTCFSATMGGRLQKKNPRLRIFPVGHANLLRFPETLKWIAQCLKDEVCTDTKSQ